NLRSVVLYPVYRKKPSYLRSLVYLLLLDQHWHVQYNVYSTFPLEYLVDLYTLVTKHFLFFGFHPSATSPHYTWVLYEKLHLSSLFLARSYLVFPIRDWLPC